MEIKPVKEIEKPKYALKTEISKGTLKKALPGRWTKSAAAKVALGTLVAMTLAGCAQGTDKGIIQEFINSITGAWITPAVPEGTTAPAMINVAPMFLHGEGRGSFGCVMVAPPVFLSEDDALAVINEAAKEYGLTFSDKHTPELNVLQPATNIYSPEDIEQPLERVDMQTDFFDREHHIAIEFVSVDDVKQWHHDTGYAISVEEYYTKDAAERLSEALEEVYGTDIVAAVLYDPCEQYRPENFSDQKEWDEAEAKTREMSEKQLAAQATDFFEWLKSQGVI